MRIICYIHYHFLHNFTKVKTY